MKTSLLIRKTILIVVSLLLTASTYSQNVSKLQVQVKKAPHDSTRLRLYCEQMESLYKAGKNDSLYVLIKQAFPIATKSHSTAYVGRLYYWLGLYYGKKRLLAVSVDTLQKSLSILRRVNDTTYLGKALHGLAMEYTSQSDYERAVKQSLYTLSFAEKSRNIHLTTSVYSLLIAIYQSMNETRLEEFYINKYIQVAHQTNDPVDLYAVYLYKAELDERQGEYGKAGPYYEKALKIAYTLKDFRVYYITEALLAMERNLRYRERFSEGVLLLTKAIAMNDQVQDLQGLAIIWNALAQNYQKQGLKKPSLLAATKAISYARQSTIPSIIMSVLPHTAAIQEANGHYQEALKNHMEYTVLKDSLFSLEKNEKIAQIQASYDLKTKENTILMLNKDAQLNRLKTIDHKQKLSLAGQEQFVLVSGIAVVTLLLGTVSYFLRRANISQLKLTRQNQENQTQAIRLKEANQLKDRLFSIIGHDLRSPVASLKASFTLLKIRNSFSDEMASLEREVNSLSYTLDNMLYWSLKQQNGLRARPQRVVLEDLVHDTLDGFTGLIRLKKLIISFDPSPVAVSMDENLTLLVLRNILHNAIKFTPSGGAIRISIRQESTTINLLIADTGIGMELGRLKRENKTNEQGTGLGLVLSDELMKSNGGGLKLESRVGHGTTVTLSWPEAEGTALPAKAIS